MDLQPTGFVSVGIHECAEAGCRAPGSRPRTARKGELSGAGDDERVSCGAARIRERNFLYGIYH